MTLSEAKEILSQAKETMQYGGYNDMMCHSHNLVKALEFVLERYDELMNAELDEVALMQHQHRIEKQISSNGWTDSFAVHTNKDVLEEFVREAIGKTPSKLKEAIERVSELLDEEDAQDKYYFEVRDGASCLEETQFTVR